MNPDKITVAISEEESGRRLDRVLAERLEVPRNQIQQWIRSARVTLGGEATKAAHLVATGEVFECDAPQRDLRRGIEPEDGELRLLYEDGDLVALDKPAGLVVHPGAGRSRGTLVHRLLSRYPEIAEVGGSGRPGIVHRLDKDTSGVMLIARSARAYEALSQAFAGREIEKRYLGLTYGTPRRLSGRIEAPIGRHPTRRKEMAIRDNGRPALTLYEVLLSGPDIAAMELDLQTGRTHQIRVHLKSIGHPLIGDPVYGEARWKAVPRSRQAALRDFPRPALHSWRVKLRHPVNRAPMEFEAPLPEDICLLWEKLTASSLDDGVQPNNSDNGL